MSDKLVTELTDDILIKVLENLRIIQGVAEDSSLPREGREIAQAVMDSGLQDALRKAEQEASRRAELY